MRKFDLIEGVDRRRFIVSVALGGVAAAGLAGLPMAVVRAEEAPTLEEAIKAAVGDKELMDGAGVITLDLPQIAENGATVPMGVSVESPMTSEDYVAAIHIFAPGNPRPNVATVHLTPKSGKAQAMTRIRLAKSQKVVVVAEMSTGKVYTASAEVKVTIGGCGG